MREDQSLSSGKATASYCDKGPGQQPNADYKSRYEFSDLLLTLVLRVKESQEKKKKKYKESFVARWCA